MIYKAKTLAEQFLRLRPAQQIEFVDMLGEDGRVGLMRALEFVAGAQLFDSSRPTRRVLLPVESEPSREDGRH